MKIERLVNILDGIIFCSRTGLPVDMAKEADYAARGDQHHFWITYDVPEELAAELIKWGHAEAAKIA